MQMSAEGEPQFVHDSDYPERSKGSSRIKQRLSSKAFFSFRVICLWIFVLSYPAVLFAPPVDFYEVLGVPRNATARRIDEVFSKRLREARDDRERDALRKAYSVLSDPSKRSDHDAGLQKQRYIEENPERLAEIRADLLGTYSVRNGGTLANLMQMIQSERRRQFEEIDRKNQSIGVYFRPGMGQSIPGENERHRVMRQILIEYVSSFLSQNPTYDQTLEYADALKGRMEFPQHQKYKPFGLKIEPEDESATVEPYARLLNYLRDQSSITEEQFRNAYFRWMKNNIRDVRRAQRGQISQSKPWFEQYTARFNRPATDLARAELETYIHGPNTESLLVHVEGLPPEQALDLVKETFTKEVIADRRDPNIRITPDLFRDYQPALDSIYRREPNLRRVVERHGGMIGWVVSFFSANGYCRYLLGAVSKSSVK
jgi:curved DNA-binding protein CbpA